MILSRLIAVLFAAFIGMLAVLSVFMHCETDIYDYGHAKSVVSHTPYIYGGLAAGTAVLVMLLCAFLERICARPERGEKAARIVFYGCGAALALAGICWILFHDELPFYDQFDVYQEARRLAGVLDEPFDAGYFSVFHRNRGIALFVSIAVRIFGDHLSSLQGFPADFSKSRGRNADFADDAVMLSCYCLYYVHLRYFMVDRSDFSRIVWGRGMA